MPIVRRWRVVKGLRLDFNESTIGCSPRVLARLRSLDAELLARYPEREPVEAEVAAFLGLDAAQVLLTNGVDEAIHLLCSTYLEPGDEAIIVAPTFAMYAIFAQAEGARLVQVLCGQELCFSFGGDSGTDQSSHTADRGGESEQSDRSVGALRDIGSGCTSGAPGRPSCGRSLFRVSRRDDSELFRATGRIFLSREHSRRPMDWLVCVSEFSPGDAGQMTMLRRVASPYNVNAAALAVLPEALKIRNMSTAMLRSASRPQRSGAGTSNLGSALLAEPCQLCTCAYWSRPSRIHSSLARAWNSGAQPAHLIRDAKAVCV